MACQHRSTAIPVMASACVSVAGAGTDLQLRQAITEGAIAAERADRLVADGRLQPAKTLGIAQAPHG